MKVWLGENLQKISVTPTNMSKSVNMSTKNNSEDIHKKKFKFLRSFTLENYAITTKLKTFCCYNSSNHDLHMTQYIEQNANNPMQKNV
jgi:hypothetical protein